MGNYFTELDSCLSTGTKFISHGTLFKDIMCA